MGRIERDPNRLFAKPRVQLTPRADGCMLMSSTLPLEPYARCVGEWLIQWATRAPERDFLVERGSDQQWHGINYAQALAQVRRISAWLLEHNPSGRPVAILSDNSIEHALLTLGAMHVGMAAVPISPAYSLISKDFSKLKDIIKVIQPGVLYVAHAEPFDAALQAIAGLHTATLLVSAGATPPANAIAFDALLSATDGAQVDAAFARIGPDTVAKLLFTSGSTGTPKGVINTQRMLCANQQQMAQLWPFLDQSPPVLVDWLPWNHTFGGNHNFNMVLRTGGTLYIDAGKPAPGLFQQSIDNLRSIAPTVYYNVPRGFDVLIAALQSDAELRRNFFSRLQVIMYAAAALPQHLWHALEKLALETTGQSIVLVSGWGSTETAPLVTSAHFHATQAGVIGLPVPGCELKLVPCGPKLEVRVRGPQVTPGYYQQPELSAQSFDEEGFYLMGDAARLVNTQQPEHGLLFDGRVSEDFKLSTGTWVNTGELRVKALALFGPCVQDLVVTGHDRDDIGLLLFANVEVCRQLCGVMPTEPAEAVVTHPRVVTAIRDGLTQLHACSSGSSTFATRALLMVEPPSIDAGEVTDKRYINQRAVLTRRANLVDALYQSPPDSRVICLRTH